MTLCAHLCVQRDGRLGVTQVGRRQLSLVESRNQLIKKCCCLLLLRLGRAAKYCDEYVCLSVRSHNSKTARPNFTIFVHVAYGRDKLLLASLRYVMYFRFCG